MKKKNIKPLVLSSLAALSLGSMSVAGTFALFTDQAETTISIGAAEVSVKNAMTIEGAYSLNGEEVGTAVAESKKSATYINGGKATVKDVNGETTEVEIEKWTPGDGVKLRTAPVNGSNVTIKARLKVVISGDLAPALVMKVMEANGSEVVCAATGKRTLVTDWLPVAPTVNPTAFDLDIEFPDHDNGEIKFGADNKDNQYQNLGATIKVSYEVVQGNADVSANLLERINTKLATNEVKDGKNANMYEAVNDLALADVATLAQIKANNYVWGADEDLFYEAAGIAADEYKYFKVYDAANVPAKADQTFSIYADGSGWTSLELKGVGFDAGSVVGMTAVSYEGAASARENIIRTNGGTLTINASQDIVHHYGDADSLNIIAVAGDSYHENGYVAFAEIKAGRMALEKGAEVTQIHLAVTGTGDAAHFDDIVIAKDEAVEMPAFSRDPVTIPEDGRLVVALQKGTEEITEQTKLDYVWLTAVGVYEQVTVSESNTEAGNKYAANLASTEQEKKDTAQQIANNIKATVGEEEYTLTATTTDGGQTWTYGLESETVADITENVTVAVAENVITVSVAGEAKETVVENGLSEQEKSAIISANHFWMDVAADDFAGGTGVENDPYLISSARELGLLAQIMAGNNAGKSYANYCDKHYKLTNDINLYGKVWCSIGIGTDGSGINQFKGYFDGNNKTISNMSALDASNDELVDHKMGTLKDGFQEGLIGYAKDATIKNVNIVGASFDNTKFTKSGFVVCCADGNTTLENCHVDATSNYHGKSNIGGLVGLYNVPGNNGLILKNCSSAATITVSSNRGAGFLGAMYGGGTKVFATDCTFSGTITGDRIGGFIGRSTCSYGNLLEGCHFKNCHMLGSLVNPDPTNEGWQFGYVEAWHADSSAYITLDSCTYKDITDNTVKSFALTDTHVFGYVEQYGSVPITGWFGVDGTMLVNHDITEDVPLLYAIDFNTHVFTYNVTQGLFLKLGRANIDFAKMRFVGEDGVSFTLQRWGDNDKFNFANNTQFYDANGNLLDGQVSGGTNTGTGISYVFSWDSTLNGWRLN